MFTGGAAVLTIATGGLVLGSTPTPFVVGWLMEFEDG
jgi:hypothetical protein